MNAFLKPLLVAAMAACAMVAYSASAAGAGTGTLGGVGRAAASGATSFAVHIDEQGAAIIRAWRLAHGLDAPGAGTSAESVSPELAQQGAFARQCGSSGGALTSDVPADGLAVSAGVRVALCV